MAIQTSCPHCQQTYELADKQIGKKVRCKSCSEAFVVRDREAERRAARSREEDESDEPRAPRRKQKGRGAGLWIGVGIGVFVLLLGCLGGGTLLWIYGPFANKVTQENFDKIQNGMTEAKVKSILGEPDVNSALLRDIATQSSGTLVWTHDNNVIYVMFLNGKVLAKSGRFVNVKRR